MTVKDTKEVADDIPGSTLNVKDGGVSILHADSPSLHLGNGVKHRGIAARRRGLLRDGLRECLTHLVEERSWSAVAEG